MNFRNPLPPSSMHILYGIFSALSCLFDGLYVCSINSTRRMILVLIVQSKIISIQRRYTVFENTTLCETGILKY